jgi:Ca-activated chloride channel family protein
MNSDDPKFTAYALDELDPADRPELESFLRGNPAAQAEIDATIRFAAQLRAQLHAEVAASLTDAQRSEVLATVPAPEAKIARFPRMLVALSSIAACLIAAASLGLLSPTIPMQKVAPGSVAVAAPTVPADALISGDLGVSVTSEYISRGLVLENGAASKELKALNDRKENFALALNTEPNPSITSGPIATPSPAAQTITTLSKAGEGTLGYRAGIETGLTQNRFDEYSSAPTRYENAAGVAWSDSAAAVEKSRPAAARLANTGPVGGAKPAAVSIAPPGRMAGVRLDYGMPVDSENETRRHQMLPGEAIPTEGNTEAYDSITDNAFLAVRENPLSTFSIDVDTASYAIVRRFLTQQDRPPKGAVRIEELINYFTYDYPQPEGDAPFSATMEVAACPWAPEHRLVRVGLKGREIAADKRPASNLVFLIDVSGSMMPPNKLPLLKQSLRMLVDQLSPEDTVSIAVYAGASGTVLEPTHDKREIRAALDELQSGGSTNGGAGIQLAYRLAERSFIKGGTNRVILATDGDFNVGVTSQSDLVDLIVRKAKGGVFLTVLGFGMDNLKDSTLEKLADKGNGNYAYIDTLNEGRKVLVEQMGGTLITIAKDVKIQVEFNPAQAASYRLIGYENRLLAKEDFNDDTKDAGEIGAGHTVTALYEVVPAGQSAPGTPAVDPLKYQGAAASEPVSAILRPISPELLTLKLRYKQPDGDVSKLLEFPLTDRGETWEKSSRDFRFAAAVAGFGMLLRESPHRGTATWESIRELAMEGRGEDRTGYRGEFLTLIDKAKAVTR